MELVYQAVRKVEAIKKDLEEMGCNLICYDERELFFSKDDTYYTLTSEEDGEVLVLAVEGKILEKGNMGEILNFVYMN